MILLRPPNDEFTMSLFIRMKDQCKIPSNWFYLWTNGLHGDFTDTHLTHNDIMRHLYTHITEDLVVIAIKDHLTSGRFDPYEETEPDMVHILREIFVQYFEKKFILITSLENLDSYINFPNVKIVRWGGDITNQYREYSALVPNFEKNLDSDRTFLSLNRGWRDHRIVLLSLIYGMDLEKHGLVSCMFKDDINEYLPWDGRTILDNDKLQTIKDGFNSFRLNQQSVVGDIYNIGENDNVGNFNNYLVNYYKETFVELISETTFTESSFLITEKTLNSIYGSCFPIFFSSLGTVSFLRKIGMDVFDDIVNHDYDTEPDPMKRVWLAVELNKQLLTDLDFVREKWIISKPRFGQNIVWAKTKMYQYYEDRAFLEFNKALIS
jgi:hypothetical protein